LERRGNGNAEREEVFVMASPSARQAKGKANKAAGRVKQAIGKAAGDRSLQAKGTAQRTKGKLQDASGRADRKVRGKANSI
jgi:uncharacterized protein YjbJ (UPF0337 family)